MYTCGFEGTYPSLMPGTHTFRTGTGAEMQIPPWPDEANGIHVSYMERQGKKFCAVRLQFEDHDLVLQNPVILDRTRHLGNRRFSPKPTVVPDELASALLDDVI